MLCTSPAMMMRLKVRVALAVLAADWVEGSVAAGIADGSVEAAVAATLAVAACVACVALGMAVDDAAGTAVCVMDGRLLRRFRSTRAVTSRAMTTVPTIAAPARM